ncbi:MAG: hypothetical protein A2068_08190 [Ignavibacteria bacterium GWB2_35_6b]|nr:MAG: hypothetical protein A2068_08190 [Ignavibacteria bacterium GWB2_35_6b]
MEVKYIKRISENKILFHFIIDKINSYFYFASFMITAIIKISRPVNFFITFFAVIIAALISSKSINDVNIIFAALAMSFACSAGNIFNDIVDVEIDKINKPDRVLPKEIISIKFAKILYGIFIILSSVCAFYNGTNSFLFLAVVNSFLVLYSTHLKKTILVGNFSVALLTASALIYGAMIAGNINAGIIPAFFAFFANFIREIIKDMEDVEGDSANNINTFPKIYGNKKTFRIILLSTVLLILFSFIPFVYKIYSIEFFIIIMTVVNPLFIIMLKILYKSQNLDALRKASAIVKLNMIIGLFAIYAGA